MIWRLSRILLSPLRWLHARAATTRLCRPDTRRYRHTPTISYCLVANRSRSVQSAMAERKAGQSGDNESTEQQQQGLLPNGEHALQTGWSFWYDKKMPKKTQDQTQYQASLHKAGSFNTLEGFWKNYVHLKRPSNISINVNVYLFRDERGHVPMWERYPNGGCWILRIRKKSGQTNTSVLGKMWQDLVLAVVGEMFEEPNVVGIGMAIRSREDLLSVWNEDNSNEKVRFNIGERLKQVLDLEPSTLIEYKHHQTAMQDMSTFRNAKAYCFAVTKGQSQTQQG